MKNTVEKVIKRSIKICKNWKILTRNKNFTAGQKMGANALLFFLNFYFWVKKLFFIALKASDSYLELNRVNDSAQKFWFFGKILKSLKCCNILVHHTIQQAKSSSKIATSDILVYMNISTSNLQLDQILSLWLH